MLQVGNSNGNRMGCQVLTRGFPAVFPKDLNSRDWRSLPPPLPGELPACRALNACARPTQLWVAAPPFQAVSDTLSKAPQGQKK